MDTGETKIFIAILLAAGILGIIIIYFIISIVSNQRRYMALQHQQLIREIAGLESERSRIVSDLHDEIGPLLAVVKFQVVNIDSTLEQDLTLIEKANNNLDEILHRIREICNQLMPQILIRKGLFTAINEFIEELDEHTAMQIKFNWQPLAIPHDTGIHVYRMIQEIVSNALKHAHANNLHIDISLKNEKLTLAISDDGKGFCVNAAARNGPGLGLKSILNRTRLLKGEMYLESAAGKGTAYTIEIPISLHEPKDSIDNSR